ncbi:hypothetical protein B0J18DRAFT_279634 [Chaetomium sp. MPI-SDFR-AT-0129]|nr:hypothetical protein B0J18DRAFT_279634 [Chaetomium sp. MPI-SDFR-AT-0129]
MPPKRRPAEAGTPSSSDLGPFNPAESLPVPASAVAPPAKRQRVSRACDQCRAARERCDGKQPQCQPCVSQSRPCTYEVSPKKRGVQTGYIRTLELALGWVFEKVPGSEETLGALLTQGGDGGHPILEGKDSDGTDRLQKRWRRSRVHRGIDRILSGEAVAAHQEEGLPLSVDASDAETSSAQPRIGVDLALPEARRLHQGTGGSPGVDLVQRLSNAEPSQHTMESVSLGTRQTHPRRIKLIANHWRLLDIYFSYTHSWLPILDKQDLFQASYAYPDHGLMIDPTSPSSAVHSTLWAALALAALHDTAASQPSLPQHAPSAEYLPMELYGIARSLLPQEDGPFRVHHSRALLLLSLFKLGEDSLSAASLLVGSAIRILLDPNVTDGDSQSLDGQKRDLSLMSCFIIDTILSVRCNRPPHLRVEDLSAVQLVSENGPDQWEPWTPCVGFGPENTVSYSNRSAAFRLSTFNQLYSIIKIVAEQESLKRQGLAQRAAPEAFLGQLQHAVNTNSPFGNFVPSAACGTASVPTPYLVRAAYLWASALAEPHGDSALLMLYDTLTQYQQIFGRSSTPSFLTTCVASLANENYVLHCSEQNREMLRRLLSTCFSKPSKPPTRPSISQPPTGSLESSAIASSTLENSSATKHSGHSATSLYEGPISTHQQSPLNNEGYNSLLTPDPVGLYQPTFPSPIIPLPLGGEPSSAVTSTHPDITTSYPFVPSASIGHNAETDALLDDLASIEYADTADVDTQFMTNLGFAPGCDITDFLSRGFGGV